MSKVPVNVTSTVPFKGIVPLSGALSVAVVVPVILQVIVAGLVAKFMAGP